MVEPIMTTILGVFFGYYIVSDIFNYTRIHTRLSIINRELNNVSLIIRDLR